MLIAECKNLNALTSVLEIYLLLASSIFCKGIVECSSDENNLKCEPANKKTKPSLSPNLISLIKNCSSPCDNSAGYPDHINDKICKDCSTLGLLCNCTDQKHTICHNSYSYKCKCEKSISWLTTAMIIVCLIVVLALLVALVAIILRRRRKALQRSRKYTLIARMLSDQHVDKTRNGRSVRIKSFRMVEEHCYEVILPKEQRVTETDQSKENFNQYLKYIQKDGAPEITGNDTLSCKQKETTPKAHINASLNCIFPDGKSTPKCAGPVQQISTGYISTLLNSQSEKFKRTRSRRNRKPTGFTLRRTASEWHTDRLGSYARDRTKSYGDLSKVPFYFELESAEPKSIHPDCGDSSNATYDVAISIPQL